MESFCTVHRTQQLSTVWIMDRGIPAGFHTKRRNLVSEKTSCNKKFKTSLGTSFICKSVLPRQGRLRICSGKYVTARQLLQSTPALHSPPSHCGAIIITITIIINEKNINLSRKSNPQRLTFPGKCANHYIMINLPWQLNISLLNCHKTIWMV